MFVFDGFFKKVIVPIIQIYRFHPLKGSFITYWFSLGWNNLQVFLIERNKNNWTRISQTSGSFIRSDGFKLNKMICMLLLFLLNFTGSSPTEIPENSNKHRNWATDLRSWRGKSILLEYPWITEKVQEHSLNGFSNKRFQQTTLDLMKM